MSGVQNLFVRNQDFCSLSRHDQSLLLQNTMVHISGIALIEPISQIRLFDDKAFYASVAQIFGSSGLVSGALATSLLDADTVFVKLMLMIMMFSTLDCFCYIKTHIQNLENIGLIQKIQDRYIELAWKYIVYQYGERRTVQCFSNMVRCSFAGIRSSEEVVECANFKLMLSGLTKEFKEKLNMNS